MEPIRLDVLKDYSHEDCVQRFQAQINTERQRLDQIFLQTKRAVAVLRKQQKKKNVDPKSDPVRFVESLAQKTGECYEVMGRVFTKVLIAYTQRAEELRIPHFEATTDWLNAEDRSELTEPIEVQHSLPSSFSLSSAPSSSNPLFKIPSSPRSLALAAAKATATTEEEKDEKEEKQGFIERGLRLLCPVQDKEREEEEEQEEAKEEKKHGLSLKGRWGKEVEMEPPFDAALEEIEQTMLLLSQMARKNLHLYQLIAQHCPVQQVVQRLVTRFGSVDAFLKDVNVFLESEWQSGGKYVLGMALPVAFSIGLAFALGFGLTGFGLLFLLGGVVVGGGICAYKYISDKDEMDQERAKIAALKEQYEAFFLRWHKPGAELKSDDFQLFLKHQEKIEKTSEVVMKLIFPEVRQQLWRSQHNCAFCLETFDKIDAKIAIVKPNSCSHQHLCCAPCLDEWERRSREKHILAHQNADILLSPVVYRCIGCTIPYSGKLVVNFAAEWDKDAPCSKQE